VPRRPAERWRGAVGRERINFYELAASLVKQTKQNQQRNEIVPLCIHDRFLWQQ
jgi:hypothetical protein